MEQQPLPENISGTRSRSALKLLWPVRLWWLSFQAKHSRFITVFVALALLVFFGLSISLLKGYVQFI